MEFSFGRSRENHQQQQQPQPKDATSSSSPTYQWAPSSSDRPTTEPPPPPVEEREHMFEKVVTPSDVGKLNRLVIPKQHAEKYFPLDPTANDKGLLLSFEDRTGKPWRFRYSYWNSSQSYVMTKGWSRFVKEKRLDAGDTVLFGRAAGRLFIDWRRRPPDPPAALPIPMTIMPRSSGWGGYFPPPAPMYGMYFRHGVPARVLHPHPGGGAAVVLDSVPVAAAAVVGHGESAAEPKRVRLFGVNLDCSQAPPAGSLPPPSPLQWRLSATAPPSGRSELPLLLPPPMDLGSPCKKEEGRRRMDSSEN